MADEKQQKPADEPLSSIETEEVSKNRTNDDSKTLVRPDRRRFREGDCLMTDPQTCQMLIQTIVEAPKGAISEVMPEKSDNVTESLLEAINKVVKENIKQIRTEVEKVVCEKHGSAERRCKLKTMSEVELLRSYNRLENMRIVGVKEDRGSDNKFCENYPQSMQNVLQLVEKVGAIVALQDISIAYRLPSHNQSKNAQS